MMQKKGIQDIARMANLSIGTVGRALLGSKGVSQSTRERVLSIAEAVGYKPDLAARALSRRRTRTRVGVCIPRALRYYYFAQLRDGILDEARRFEHLGFELSFRFTERLGHREVEKLSELIAEPVRALIVAPGDPKELVSVINEAEANGIRVICVDSDVGASSRSTVVAIDAEVCGKLAAELMGMFLNPGDEVAVITGHNNVELHRKKAVGFCEVFPQVCQEGKVVEIVDSLDADEAMRKGFDLFERRKSLSGVYVRTGDCLAICNAASVLGLAGKIKIVASELSAEMVPYIESGVISASINGRPYVQGQMAMRLLVDHFMHGYSLPSHYSLNPHIVLRSNLYLFRELRSKLPGREPAESPPEGSTDKRPERKSESSENLSDNKGKEV